MEKTERRAIQPERRRHSQMQLKGQCSSHGPTGPRKKSLCLQKNERVVGRSRVKLEGLHITRREGRWEAHRLQPHKGNCPGCAPQQRADSVCGENEWDLRE